MAKNRRKFYQKNHIIKRHRPPTTQDIKLHNSGHKVTSTQDIKLRVFNPTKDVFSLCPELAGYNEFLTAKPIISTPQEHIAMKRAKLKKSASVVQSNKLIEARYTLTVSEQRLIFIMISLINKDDEDLKEYSINLTEFAKILNISPQFLYQDADKITERIMGRILHIQEGAKLIKLHWVSLAIHEGANLTISFHPKLKPYLLQLKGAFTNCNLATLNKFRSMYSIRIYQLLYQYKNFGSRMFEISELKKIIGLDKDQYPSFEDFKRRIINPAKLELDKKAEISFILEKIKTGRKITHLKFIIIDNKPIQPPAKIKSPAPAAKNHPPLSSEMQEFEQWLKENDAFMYGFMQEHGPNALMVQAEYRKFLERREGLRKG